MPRTQRKLSSTGIYHVFMRGVNKQQIFEDDEDNRRFLEDLTCCRDKDALVVHGFCLMGNHVHLVLQQGEEHIGTSMKRLGARFVRWYNDKYDRVGPLFQGRFASEAIETNGYLLSAIRYVHLNPVKAGICRNPAEYRFSSYHDYFLTHMHSAAPGLVNAALVEGFISTGEFLALHNDAGADNADSFIDDGHARRRFTDAEARDVIFSCGGGRTVEEFRKLGREARDACLSAVVRAGVPRAMISRLTGVCSRTIANAVASGD